MKRLLVYSYFCPNDSHRPGGVQQIVGPLLSSLEVSHNWAITVVHAGQCHGSHGHVTIENVTEPGQPDAVNPDLLIAVSREIRRLSDDHDVVLSIDRLLPCTLHRPCVLMSNTLAYHTEIAAVQGASWISITVPTNVFADSVRVINNSAIVEVIRYGLPSDFLRIARHELPMTQRPSVQIVRVPHRPDRRKGQREAIMGLARTNDDVTLEIAWLDDPEYESYRVELEALADHLGVNKRVRFCDWMNGDELLSAVTASSATLHVGTYEESFGLSMIESIIFGRPAVIVRQPAVREVAGSTRLLIPITHPEQWYDALVDYWSRTIEVNEQLEEREHIIKSLSMRRMAAEYDKVLTRSINALQRFVR